MLLRAQFVCGMSLMFLSGFHSAAAADPISFTFTTTLTSVSGSASSVLGVDLRPGQSFVGLVSFALTGPDETEDPGTAIFQASGRITLPFLQHPMQFVQVILDEANPAVGDFTGFLARDRQAGIFSVVGFQDPSGALLTSTNVPDVSTLARFPGGPFQAFVINTDDPFGNLVVGTVSGVAEAAPIPEPASLLLFATGAVAAACRARKRRRVISR